MRTRLLLSGSVASATFALLLGVTPSCSTVNGGGMANDEGNNASGNGTAGASRGSASSNHGSGSSSAAQGNKSSASATAADGGVSNAGDAGLPPLMRGPTPADGGTSFPFPQNRQASRCTYPTRYDNDDVVNAYNGWVAALVTSDSANGHRRVQRTSSDGNGSGCTPPGSTVSEGIGYGMLIAVYMNDQSLFDDLWLYEQGNLDKYNLMNWAPGPGASGMGCTGAATDADEDMAFALLMADKQWGGQGTLSTTYKNAAVAQIQAIWNTEVYNFSFVRAGDGTWATSANINPSYFAPAYYRAFAAADPKTCPMGTTVDDAMKNPCDLWWGVVDQVYRSLTDAMNPANGNSSNGLVPAWCNDGADDGKGDSGVVTCTSTGMSGQPFNFQYDSCRIPFRVGLDWCWNGESRAQAYAATISAFYSGIGASSIVDGYNLDGTALSGTMTQSVPFVGPGGVGAMTSSSYQSFVDDTYAIVAGDTAHVGGEYYSRSWAVLSLLMMSGNFLDYTQETPLQ